MDHLGPGALVIFTGKNMRILGVGSRALYMVLMVRVSAGFFPIEPVVQPLGGVATFQLAVYTCWQLSCRYLRPVLVTTLRQLTNLVFSAAFSVTAHAHFSPVPELLGTSDHPRLDSSLSHSDHFPLPCQTSTCNK